MTLVLRYAVGTGYIFDTPEEAVNHINNIKDTDYLRDQLKTLDICDHSVNPRDLLEWILERGDKIKEIIDKRM